MYKFDHTEIKWEDYNIVLPEEYALYYEQDTMVIRVGAYAPHYFVKKNAKGTKEQMNEALERKFVIMRDKFTALLTHELITTEKFRQEKEKFFLLRKEYNNVYFPMLDNLISSISSASKEVNSGGY